MDDLLRARLRRLPKAELHLHLEGSLSPDALWRLAQRHGFPHGLDSLEACRRLYRFDGFTGFIHAIKTASQLLVTPADYAEAVTSLARHLAVEGVVYAEVFLSVGILLWRRVEIPPYWEAIEAARHQAEAATGVRIRWIFDAVRQLGAEAAQTVVDWALRLQTSESVLGIGIGGDERLGPVGWFAPAFERARAAGLRCTAHAGETTGADVVRQTRDALGVERIGHGLGAALDPELCAEIATSPTTFDICPTSNLLTGAWPQFATHPVRQFYDCGITVAVGSDDPGIFSTGVVEELARLHEAVGFSPVELERVVGNSFRAAFLPAEEKALWLSRLQAACEVAP